MSISVSVDTTKLDEIIAKLPGNRDKIIKAARVRIFLAKLANARRLQTGALRDNSEVVNEQDDGPNVEFNQEYAALCGTWYTQNDSASVPETGG